jgi:hypothetical protein
LLRSCSINSASYKPNPVTNNFVQKHPDRLLTILVILHNLTLGDMDETLHSSFNECAYGELVAQPGASIGLR